MKILSWVILFFCLQFGQGGMAMTPIEVSPWHTYKVAQEIINDLNDIREYKNIFTPIRMNERDSSKTPTDTYSEAYRLLENLNQLSKNREYQVSPIVLPKKLNGRQVPIDVLKLLIVARNHVKNIRKNTGVTTPPRLEQLKPGVMPPDVCRLVEKANELVKTLK